MSNCNKCDATMTCPDCQKKVTMFNTRYIMHGGAKAIEGLCPLCHRKWIKVLLRR